MIPKEKITGSEALMRSLEYQGVKTIFGYPGGAIMPVFDALYDHRDKLNHILVRHGKEQHMQPRDLPEFRVKWEYVWLPADRVPQIPLPALRMP